MEELVIADEKGRIDKIIAQRFESFSRSQVQQWIEQQHILVNQQPTKANYKVRPNDRITIQPVEPEVLDVVAEDIPLDIVYEDEDVVVVNKPQGMVVHPSAGHYSGTLVNALMYHIDHLSGINGVIRPGIVHRIDKDTSGLLMVAKTDLAHESLSRQLAEKTSMRRYIALVHGNIAHDKGVIDAPLARHPKERKKQAVVEGGRHAVTHFQVLERFGQYTLVECRLETGRTHQIRVHMQYIGHPLAGDPVYGPRKTLKGKGQFLHAASLGFEHPRTGEWLEFSAPLPDLFEETLEKLRHAVK